MTHRFRFAFVPPYRYAGAVFGITERTTLIEVDSERFRARFGPWHVDTPRANVASAEPAGPYAFLKTAGPARLGVTDRSLTFATNPQSGVLISFHEPVVGIDRFGLIKHPTLTVTPVDPAGLVEVLGN